MFNANEGFEFSGLKIKTIVGIHYVADNPDWDKKVLNEINTTFGGDYFKAYMAFYPYHNIHQYVNESKQVVMYVGTKDKKDADESIYFNTYAYYFWKKYHDRAKNFINQLLDKKPFLRDEKYKGARVQIVNWARANAINEIAKENGWDGIVETVPPEPPVMASPEMINAFKSKVQSQANTQIQDNLLNKRSFNTEQIEKYLDKWDANTNKMDDRLYYLLDRMAYAQVPLEVAGKFIVDLCNDADPHILQITEKLLNDYQKNGTLAPDMVQKLLESLQKYHYDPNSAELIAEQYNQQLAQQQYYYQQQQVGVNSADTQVIQQPIQPQQQYSTPQANVDAAADKQRTAAYNEEEQTMINQFIDNDSLQLCKRAYELLETCDSIKLPPIESQNEVNETVNQNNDTRVQQSVVNQNMTAQTQQPIANQKKNKVAYTNQAPQGQTATQNDYGELNAFLDNSAEVLAEFDNDVQSLINPSYEINETNQNAAPAQQNVQANTQGVAAYNGYDNSCVPGMTQMNISQPQYGMPPYGAGVSAYGQYNATPQADQIHMYRGEGNF